MAPLNAGGQRRDVITIGASAGGVAALGRLFEILPANLAAAIAVVQHRSPPANLRLCEVLCRRAALPCIEPQKDMRFAPGFIFLAPRDQHLILADGRISPNRGPKAHSTRPAVDPLFISAAQTYGPRVVGVLLTGGGEDGVSGLIAIKKAGGLSIAQDPAQAAFPSMPINAILYDHVDRIMSLDAVALALEALSKGESIDGPPERSQAERG